MSRNIVLLSDGTGNSAAKVWRTNVRRTFEALDLSGNDQIAFYDDGVGTLPCSTIVTESSPGVSGLGRIWIGACSSTPQGGGSDVLFT